MGLVSGAGGVQPANNAAQATSTIDATEVGAVVNIARVVERFMTAPSLIVQIRN